MDNTKVIFLDVDGVLNDSRTPDRTPAGFIGIDRNKVTMLKRIVENTNAIIVLTSTWKSEWERNPSLRTEDGQYLDDMLSEQGLAIYDKTTDRISNRGYGINRWLFNHPEVESWVVLDDDVFMDYASMGVMPHLVQSTYHHPGGLTSELADQAIEKLNSTGIF